MKPSGFFWKLHIAFAFATIKQLCGSTDPLTKGFSLLRAQTENFIQHFGQFISFVTLRKSLIKKLEQFGLTTFNVGIQRDLQCSTHSKAFPCSRVNRYEPRASFGSLSRVANLLTNHSFHRLVFFEIFVLPTKATDTCRHAQSWKSKTT